MAAYGSCRPRVFDWSYSKRVCSAQRDRDKPRQGVAANTLDLFCNGAVGFIDWLDLRGCVACIFHKVPAVAQVFAMTVKRWIPEK